MSVWCCSDLHGNITLFHAIMDKINPDDTLIFLGDAIDRGLNGWDILKKLIYDPRVIYIKGNHEDMMVKALADFPNYSTRSSEMEAWQWNGSLPTLETIDNDDPEIVKSVLKLIKNLPIQIIYKNSFGDEFWLSHAGCDWTEDGFNSINSYDLIWDRDHFIYNRDFQGPSNIFIVHGHTPIPLLIEDLPQDAVEPWDGGAFYYAEGHKICIDCGAHFTGRTVLLNLDTFDEEIFVI